MRCRVLIEYTQKLGVNCKDYSRVCRIKETKPNFTAHTVSILFPRLRASLSQ